MQKNGIFWCPDCGKKTEQSVVFRNKGEATLRCGNCGKMLKYDNVHTGKCEKCGRPTPHQVRGKRGKRAMAALCLICGHDNIDFWNW